MTNDILPFYTHEQAWHDEALPDLHKYPAIGVEAYQQMQFLRTDPMPYVEFEHVKAEKRRMVVKREIVCGFAAVLLVVLAFLLLGNT